MRRVHTPGVGILVYMYTGQGGGITSQHYITTLDNMVTVTICDNVYDIYLYCGFWLYFSIITRLLFISSSLKNALANRYLEVTLTSVKFTCP